MDKRMTPADRELYKRVDEVLHYIWDPIGVSTVPSARDEYFSYFPHVFTLLKTNNNADHIASYLFDVSTQKMGLRGNKKKDLEVAELLLEWKDTIDKKFS
jgi:hypothetical protein